MPDQKNKIKDDHCQFFLKYEDWRKEFNQLVICRVFPETWSKFSIHGVWEGKSAGGSKKFEVEILSLGYPNLQENFPAGPRLQKEFVQLDTDDRWFNNPQYRIKVTKKTRLVLSLMQKDNRSSKGSNIYTKCNFMIVKAKQRNNRIWEMPEEKNILSVGYKDDEEVV